MGRHDEALTPVRLATRDQAREFRQRLVLSGTQWVEAVPADRSRRALVAAASALEAEGIDWMRYPQFTGDYDLNATNVPSARYAWLLGIEQNAMRRTGRPLTWMPRMPLATCNQRPR